MKLISNADLTKTQGIRSLIYGRAGVGKTMLVATCTNPLLLSIEGGTLSLSPENIEKIFQRRAAIPILEIKTAQELRAAIKSPYLKKATTIYVDSLSELAELVLAEKKEEQADQRKAYGDMFDEVVKMLRKFFKLKKDLVFTAKLGYSKKEDYAVPAMPGGQLGPYVAHLFDEVFIMRVKDDAKLSTSKRILQTWPNEDFDAKDRSGKLGRLERPDIQSIFNKIRS